MCYRTVSQTKGQSGDVYGGELHSGSEIAQLCLTLCDPMDYTVHGILQSRIWSGKLFLSPGDLPNPEIEPRSPALQVDSQLSHKGSPSNIEALIKTMKKMNFRSMNQKSRVVMTELKKGKEGPGKEAGAEMPYVLYGRRKIGSVLWEPNKGRKDSLTLETT